MNSFHWTQLASALCLIAAVVVNLVLTLRSVRELRENRAIREILWAYEREMKERGVTLPPRCAWCCEVLPDHVGKCPLRWEYPDALLTSRFTRPKIKYFPNGEQPPDTGDKRKMN
jgi:hypothetical protein